MPEPNAWPVFVCPEEDCHFTTKFTMKRFMLVKDGHCENGRAHCPMCGSPKLAITMVGLK